MTKKRIKNVLWLLLFCVLMFFIIRVLTSSGASSEMAERIVLMPDSEFAENTVFFRNTDGSLREAKVDASNCQEIIASIRRPENMFWECTTTLRSSDGLLRRTGRYYKGGSSYVAEMRNGNTVDLRVVSNGKTARVSSGSESRTVSSNVQYSPEAIMGMADLSYFLALPKESIKKVELVKRSGESCLYIECSFSDLGLTEKYYLSLTYGIPLSAESFQNGNLIYSAETVTVDQSVQPPSFYRY